MICRNRCSAGWGQWGRNKEDFHMDDLSGRAVPWFYGANDGLGRDKPMGYSELRFQGHVQVEMPSWWSEIGLKLTRLQSRAVTGPTWNSRGYIRHLEVAGQARGWGFARLNVRSTGQRAWCSHTPTTLPSHKQKCKRTGLCICFICMGTSVILTKNIEPG